MQEPPQQQSPTRADLLIGGLLVGAFGGFAGAALAWMTDAGTPWIVAWAVVACLLGIVLTWLTWRVAVQPALALRWATEEPTAPRTLGEAIKGALRRQQGFLVFDAIFCGVLRGGVLGGLLGALLLSRWGTASALLGALAAGVLGSAFLAILELLGDVASTALSITVVRKCGLPVGYAIIGALSGAAFGLVLWERWFHVDWSLTGTLAMGAPMALLFAALGWQRSRHKRPPA
jgi:hypothetical protein